MSGITGFYDLNPAHAQDDLEYLLRRMTDTLSHRGPDEAGVWRNAAAGIGLGVRRLAVRDLAPTGWQPLVSADGRYGLAFDGALYNFSNLREELLVMGHIFRGRADTEVALAAIRQWGLLPAVQRFNGLFAFALWDAEEQTLHLVRDRLGVRPLYYGWADATLLFGSELKALRAHPAFHAEIDRNALALYLRYGYIPAPHTIYRGFAKLLPGHILTIWPGSEAGDERLEAYWSPRAVVEKGLTQPFDGDDTAAVEALEGLLARSISLRASADVPLGALLSSATDSATVVALLQKQNHHPLQTFAIGLHGAHPDSLGTAKAIANHLGTDHNELSVTAEKACSILPRLSTLYDEPFSDPAQILALLLAEMARSQVTVGLSGAGGNEIFGSLNRYSQGLRTWKAVGWASVAWRKRLAGLATTQANQLLRRMNETRLQKMAETLNYALPEAVYLDLITHWKRPSAIVIDGQEPLTAITDPLRWMNTSTFAQRMMSLDLMTYIPDGLLTRIDRASLGVGLETRLPFLDNHEMIEFAWKLPERLKTGARKEKWILRQVLTRYVPAKLLDHIEPELHIPIEAWLRGPLKDWAEALLDETRLSQEGFFHPEPIRQKWQEHLSGARNWQAELWDVLIFQSWLETNL